MAEQSPQPSPRVFLPLYRGAKDGEIRRNNSFAYTGCVLALVAFLFNPLAILSILAIVFSAIGLAKSHDLDAERKVSGRGTAIAGLILGLIGVAYVGSQLATAFA